MQQIRTYAFIDASNLFYGGEKSCGVETHRFPHNPLQQATISIEELEQYLVNLIKNQSERFDEAYLILLSRHLRRVRFYLKLKQFGYNLFLKQVKLYNQEDGSTKRKVNCDVEMTFYLMKEIDNFDRVIILSGDGDFLPILKHLRDNDKKIIILARGLRTAKEIKKFAGGNFRDFTRLRSRIIFEEK